MTTKAKTFDMSKYPQTQLFLQLERVRQIAGKDYKGKEPTQAELWKQVSDCHLLAMGVER